MSTAADILLEARGIAKSFPGVQALDGVDLTVRRGRLHAVVGENGAGKSTLMNILAGAISPDAGDIRCAGRRVIFPHPRAAQDAGISIIYQELCLVPELSVAENIFLGREPCTRSGLIDFRRMHRDAAELLAQLELAVDPGTPLRRLRVGAQQIVEIAKALALRSRVIIMDEPTSAISKHEVDILFRLIRQLKERGLAVIYITHKLDELPHVADDVSVLRDGRLVAADRFDALSRDEIVRLMIGREFRPVDPRPAAATAERDEVLRVHRLALRSVERPNEWAVRDVSFSVRRGEIVGIFGLLGAGRTELLETIFGLHPRQSRGTIYVAGRPVTIRTPRDAIRAGLALAPEDRKAAGLVLPMGVLDNASLAVLDRASQHGFLRPRRERQLVAPYLDRLRVTTRSLSQPVRNLSGGNQQKVVLARWLATNPRVLLLDEPTRGIDIRAKRDLYALVRELAGNGLGVVVASSELPEIVAVADRILVMAEGRVTGEFRRGDVTEEQLLQAALRPLPPTG